MSTPIFCDVHRFQVPGFKGTRKWNVCEACQTMHRKQQESPVHVIGLGSPAGARIVQREVLFAS